MNFHYVALYITSGYELFTFIASDYIILFGITFNYIV